MAAPIRQLITAAPANAQGYPLRSKRRGGFILRRAVLVWSIRGGAASRLPRVSTRSSSCLQAAFRLRKIAGKSGEEDTLTNDPTAKPSRRVRSLAAALVGLVLLAGATWLLAEWTRKRALDSLADSSAHVLTLVVESLRGELAKHQSTPFLLARNPLAARIVTGSAAPEEVRAANEELARLVHVTDSSDIYLMNTSGMTVAASNHAQPRSFIGQNFDYRPYFTEAMKGRPGRYFALGTTSGERGYYFAQPIFDGRYVVGVAVVKVQVGELEAAWRSADHEIMVVDEDGVVFLSSSPSWVLKTLSPLSPAARLRIIQQRRYDERVLAPLDLRVDPGDITTARLAELAAPSGPVDTGVTPAEAAGRISPPERRAYLMQSRAMVDAGWTVHILARTTQVVQQTREAIALLLAAATTLLLAGIALHQRRRRVAERIQLQASVNAELERRVCERTDELTRTNQQLEAEVAERRRTESELRHTQSELVQASKLAALGQLSAGLSHELNQPLAAIRSYADNALKFVERQRYDTASSNLASIVDLTERMARIIRHLRTYARKEPTTVKATSVRKSIDDALTLLKRRIDEAGARVRVDVAIPEPEAVAGEIRLQQVLVNLISNALDAMKDSADKSIEIRAAEDGDAIMIEVRDTGPGIAPEHLASVFDPFFTTKDVGEGLGLGLSITYGIVQQFGGTISARNSETGGAIFAIRLRPARTLVENAA